MRSNDPRLTDAYVRRISSGNTTITLVGVVHDHPASKFRTQQIITEVNPTILALELPPLAVPLFTEYAQDDESPPRTGGEMSTAIQAARTDTIVGIDGPSLEFTKRLLEQLLRENHPLDTARSILANLASVSKHAAKSRLAALTSRTNDVTIDLDESVDHECEWSDDPAIQAQDEHDTVRQARAVMNTFQTSNANELQKSTRDRYMADQIESLQSEKSGDIVAIIGIAHLDSVAEHLKDGLDTAKS